MLPERLELMLFLMDAQGREMIRYYPGSFNITMSI